MDFRKLSRALQASDLGSINDTDTLNISSLPSNILEALVPGYSIISRYASAYLHVDVSILVTAGLLLLALFKSGSYLGEKLMEIFEATCMSSVYIDEQDDLFDMVMAWLAAHQQYSSRTRKMRAKTQRGTAADEAYNAATDEALDENGLFNFARWSARMPPRYEPYYGKQFLWHQGRLFWFKRYQKSEGGRMQVTVSSHTPEDDIIRVDCIGRSIEPVKDLLRAVRMWSLTRTTGTTTIRHPATKERIRYGAAWSKTTSRPSRPMDTVILDSEQKDMIVRDMNEFLHPASPEWYARRGIPYRRGYLFHGPPGTGKTSLSFALAGIFGLEIYAMSLQEPTLTDSELMQLFGWLPRRCVILLEDIDAAGLVREDSNASKDGSKKGGNRGKKELTNGDNKNTDTSKTESSDKSDGDFTLRDLARELKAIQTPKKTGSRGDNQSAPQGLSLSGVLNAIDGVATHEGRVLIMTTNHPEKLDAALIRPGRVDRKIEFRLAMEDQLRELFVRMYATANGSDSTKNSGHAAPLTNGHIKTTTPNGTYVNGTTKPSRSASALTTNEHDDDSPLSHLDLESLAEEFASKIPDDTFTPAEVQNLLMRHKNAPMKTVALTEDWVRDTLAEKEKERLARLEVEEVRNEED